MSKSLKPAEKLLADLGIEEPNEIDVEAIAHLQGLIVRYQPLDSCDALIMGNGDRGVVTINSRTAPQRRRFSLAHELGHWHFHRHRISLCAASDIERGSKSKAMDDERVADRFGSELLMPTYLLVPSVGRIRYLDWPLVDRIAKLFDTSIPATAIRLVEANIVPSLLICHRPRGRAWFVRSSDVPEVWFPQLQLDSRSAAFEMLHGGRLDHSQQKVGADTWFDRYGAERFEVLEQSKMSSSGDVLTLLNILNYKMLEAG